MEAVISKALYGGKEEPSTGRVVELNAQGVSGSRLAQLL